MKNKGMYLAAAAVGAVLYAGAPPQITGLADYPTAVIDEIRPEHRSPELVRFIEGQRDMADAFNDPASRLRVDPRRRGIKTAGPYRVKVSKVKDGDTIEVVYLSGLCGWFPCPGSKGDIRIWALDSGETKRGAGQSNADCDDELAAGERAKAFAAERLLNAAEVYAFNLRPDPYANRWVATIAYRTAEGDPLSFFHIDALQAEMPDGRNVFAWYDPIANQVLREGGATGFGKRKIWCDG